MNQARDAQGNLLTDAQRLTRFGRFFRSTSLDELPELLTLQPSVLGLAGIVKTRSLTPMKVTLELPDEWAASFPARETEWAEVVTAGLHRRQSRIRQEINHFADVADTLAELPSPEQVLALHPSPALAERIQFLLAKKNDAGLTPDETAEWDEIMRVEHLMRVAKAKAAFKLKAGGAAS